jgi:hypothetical protein
LNFKPFILLTLLSITACDQVQQATAVDCTALFDHLVDVAVKDNAKQAVGKDDPAAALAGIVAGVVGRAALNGMGEKDRFLNRCQASMRKYEVQACLKKTTSAELKACGMP